MIAMDWKGWLWRLTWPLQAAASPGALRVGDAFPDFGLHDAEGHLHTLSEETEAEWTVLWFTNLCEDCRGKAPLLEELRTASGGRFRILAVSLLGDETALPLSVGLRVGFPILLDPGDAVAEELGLPHAPGACPLRNLFIVDRSRRIHFHHHLSAMTPEAFRALWRGLLSEPARAASPGGVP